jgi:MFS family permease
LLTAAFAEGEARNRALGFWGAVGSAGAIGGQLLGGLLTDLAGWRSIFLINLPIGLLAMILALRVLPESRVTGRPRLDLPGAVTLTGGLAALTLALTRFAEGGVDPGFVVTAGAAILLLVGFVRIELTRPNPLFQFGLLRNQSLRVGNAALAVNAAAVTGALFFTTLQLQLGYGYSPLAVGLAFAPVTLIVLVVSPFAGRLIGRFGLRAMLIAGPTCMGLGLLFLSRLPAAGTYGADVLPGLALLAFGAGLSYAPSFVAGTSGVAEADQGLASGLLNTAQELGAAVGLALLALVAAIASAEMSDAPIAGYRAGFVGALIMAGLSVLAATRLGPHPRATVIPAAASD